MSWHYSRALVEAYSLENPSDGRASALLSGSPTARLFLPSAKMTEFSRLSRFGMTSEPLTDALGMDVLMWFLVGFRAKTFPLQEKAKALTGSAAGCGEKWHESFAKYDPATSSWRTRQHSLLGGLDEFSETWPKWGSMRNGECWERPTLATTTDEEEYGLLPTVTVCGNYNRIGASATSGDGVATVWKRYTGSFPSAENLEVLMGMPPGWTALEPLETLKSHSAPPSRLESSTGD